MTRAASVLLRVLGLALVLAGLMGFALIGGDGTWTAHGHVPAGRTAVLLGPSVVSVRGPSVTVRVEPADDAHPPVSLFLGRGRSDDLSAYAQDPAVSRVVGLSRSRQLDVRAGPAPVTGLATSGVRATGPDSAASATSAGWPAPTSVDLWQQQVSGPTARALTWRPTSGARSVLVAAEDGAPLPALDLEVSWTDHRWVWIPAIALLLGLGLLVGGFELAGGLVGAALSLGGARARLLAAATSRAPRSPRAARPARPSRASRARRDTELSDGTEPLDGTVPSDGTELSDGTVPSDGTGVRATEVGPAPEVAAAPDVTPAAAGSAAHVDDTRRAARGRRRKPTAWQRVRAKAASVSGRRSRQDREGDRS
jgi:hypothetical protein